MPLTTEEVRQGQRREGGERGVLWGQGCGWDSARGWVPACPERGTVTPLLSPCGRDWAVPGWGCTVRGMSCTWGGYPGPGHRGTAGPAGEGHRGLDAHGTTGTMSSIPARAGSPDAIGQRSLVSTWSPRGLLGSGNLQWCPSLPGGTWGSFSFRQSGVGKSSWLLRWWTGSSAEQSNLYCTAASPATHTHILTVIYLTQIHP